MRVLYSRPGLDGGNSLRQGLGSAYSYVFGCRIFKSHLESLDTHFAMNPIFPRRFRSESAQRLSNNSNFKTEIRLRRSQTLN